LIALIRRGFLYLALPITPCALTFPSLETSCKPLRRRESVPCLIIWLYICHLHNCITCLFTLVGQMRFNNSQ
jgi:hypothetical protein